MINFAKKAAFAAIVTVYAFPGFAADLPEPPPVIEQPQVQVVDYGGWYIRGDVDFHKPQWGGADYIVYGPPPGTKSFDSGDLKGALSLGAGVGYQVTNYFRTDLTFDYWFKSRFEGHTSCTDCSSTDTSNMSAMLLLANAYVDLGHWKGFTPYIGAGIGGAYVKWDDLNNTIEEGTFTHTGAGNWRFAWGLMAGTSYCLSKNLNLDVGYRFTHINGGRMFEFAPTAGPGFDRGFNTHEVRAGLRYSFGETSNSCSEPVPVAYEPEPEPVYTK
ncbi:MULTISPECIES: outer membrane protein [unclassified Mesorhizobium]|uniref:outer membrane protein n=1 Tax=unclassified Mesorhizobium TaxID=325217 RepID=UPI00086C0D66|nr:MULTISPECIES: outer membrane protein [unclassified Mesorhizobium]MBN9255010.1 porin family protein [Mesorhizobium sp.]ODT13127.1 MAG: porin [Mesorhizobium sp. SCN 65-12]OJX76082.1 MAG: porin [Mesorhizobium sp. 65-26]